MEFRCSAFITSEFQSLDRFYRAFPLVFCRIFSGFEKQVPGFLKQFANYLYGGPVPKIYQLPNNNNQARLELGSRSFQL